MGPVKPPGLRKFSVRGITLIGLSSDARKDPAEKSLWRPQDGYINNTAAMTISASFQNKSQRQRKGYEAISKLMGIGAGSQR
ncbi:hypothetical protein RRG08_034445 [Elysia crispata]|uniref:Uncharacterized protein n=1 Tax=Elysia crispata TaxID=231223 RepID=A0AAE1CLG1_9GAST|nr:hypothetical protein RRG08_034445 [Elysia crispata]